VFLSFFQTLTWDLDPTPSPLLFIKDSSY
jgi:hypothetical protein